MWRAAGASVDIQEPLVYMSLFRKWSVVCCWLLIATHFPAHAAPESEELPASVTAHLNKAEVPLSDVSAVVVAVGDAQSPLLRTHAEIARNPASIAKLLTTAAALDHLGSDFTWFTDFYYTGRIERNQLVGNLHIRGGGDPKFVIERVQEAMQNLRTRGITTIKGNLVLDNSAFDLPQASAGDFDGEVLRPYNVQPDALMVNFKSVILKFKPNRKKGVAEIVVEPPMAGLKVPASIPLRKGRCGDWRTKIRATLTQATQYRFAGRYPSACGEQEWGVAYIDPAAYAGKALLGIWQSVGGRLTGRVTKGRVPVTAKLLYRAPSLPLRDIIMDVNKFSNNMMAQQVFLTLAMTPNQPATYDAARQKIGQWWNREMGNRIAAPTIDNGSGLSRDGRITADALVALLQHAAQHPQFKDFYDSLGIAGVDGTVSRMGRDGSTPLAIGNARLKTGTLKDVSAIAGYVTGVSGQTYVVVAMINHENAPKARTALYQLVEWAAAR